MKKSSYIKNIVLISIPLLVLISSSQSNAQKTSSQIIQSLQQKNLCIVNPVKSTIIPIPVKSNIISSSPVIQPQITNQLINPSVITTTPLNTTTWIKCADEFATCNFNGFTKTVRFGVGTSFITKNFTNSVSCSSGNFGSDPMPNVVKACYISTVAPVVPPVVVNPVPVIVPPVIVAPVISTMNDGTMGMPYVNLALAPKPEIGYNILRLIPQNHVPILNAGTDNGDFRIQCGYSHMLNDDPIVYPNQSGKAHLHTFFGNTQADSKSTPESLVASGNSTCDGGIMNRSAYWIPSIIDTRTGKPIKPTGMNVYYKTGNKTAVKMPPKGLRMIAGNMKATSKQPFMHFWCNNVAGSDQGYIPNCPVGDALIAVVPFPAWWDGKNLDSPDHKSHMSYVKTAIHTVQIPDITYNIRYDVKTGDDLSKWRLSSDMYSNEIKGGYSLHGDWMNGWTDDPVSKKNFSQIFTEKCLQAGMNCGNALLGDGRQYYY